MIQNIKIPGCGRGPLALADGSNILGHCLGRSQWPLAVGLRRSLWPKQHPNARAMAAFLGPWPALRAMPRLEPWPKILDIQGCAWGKPVGSRRPGNPGLRDTKCFYSHKNRAVTKPSSKCLPRRGETSGLDSEWLRRLSATLLFYFLRPRT